VNTMRVWGDIRRIALAIVALTGFFAKAAGALTLPVTEFSLGNGMDVIVIEDHRAPVVLHAVNYKVGGADEEPGKTGLAHFFEHLMFKGTTRYPQNTFDRLLDENGAERNAFTNLETTFYYERANVALLPQLMDLEADRMQNLVLTQQVLDTERKVVQEERRTRTESDAYGTALEKMTAIVFKTHPYGRPVVGLPEDVARLTLDDALSFYRMHYMPANAILLVVGDVLPADVRQLAEKYYGPLVNRGKPLVVQRQPEPARANPERLELEDARITDSSISRTYNVGLNALMTPRQAAAMVVLSSILGSNSQSRLIKQLVTKDQLASSISSALGSSTDEYGLFYITALPRSSVDVKVLEHRIDAMLQDVKDNGVTEAELRDAIDTADANNIYARDNAMSLGVTAVDTRASGRALTYIDQVDAELDHLTPSDVQAAAQKVFDANHSVTMIMRPKH
jgi:zinc protease